MRKINKAGIIIKPHVEGIKNIITELIRYLKNQGIECILEEAAARKIKQSKGLSREDIPHQVDLVVVLGGDGTLLSIAHRAAQENVPVMGVNMGSLGFLTEVPLDEIYLTLDAFLKGESPIVSSRLMLNASCAGKTFQCLNDVVINKGALARMIQCTIWINEKEVLTTKADGLIISTPTGSTAYSLSAGGPIIHPHIPAFIIAPICPHTLSFRPMVISSDSVIRIKLLTGGEEVFLTLDGQRGNVLSKNDIIHVVKSPYSLDLISSPKRNYFNLLQEKLGWGSNNPVV